MQLSEFTAVFAYLEAAFPHSKVSPQTARVYFDTFGHETPERLRRAARVLAQECDYFPTAKRLRDALDALDGPQLSGSEAWSIVQEEMHRGWFDPTPCWPDPRIEEALRIFGGWQRYTSEALVSERTANRARFIEAFDAASSKARRESVQHSVQIAERRSTALGGPVPIQEILS